ncbi:FAD-dependent monooxygenase [Streptomyces sp. NPDC059816]|uniref:FAD-dependent monooxygenase n=1 Tax=Streptomyces sp. NPDC059816 TaxID=3346960 RepID=UPI003654FD07
MSSTRDVVVIGAGPTGLALAIALRVYGLDVLVVDRSADTKHEPRASVIWQRAQETLRDLGCADAIVARGLRLRQGEFRVRGRVAGVQEMEMEHTGFPGPLAIEQDAVEALMRDRLQELGTEVRWSTEGIGVQVGAEGAQVDLRGPDGRVRTVGAHWVVSCEGSRSLVRRTLGIPFDGERRTNLQCVQLNARPRWGQPYRADVTQIFINHRVTLVAGPVPGGATRFYAFLPDPDPDRWEPPSVPEMEAVVAAATGEPVVGLEPSEPRWANRARFHDRIAGRLREGRALLVGDSAHVWAPIGGRGLNTGLLGAHNLGWKLAAVHYGWAPDALLDTYDSEQRRTARSVMRAMRRNVVELPPNRATFAAIRLLLPLMMSSDRIVRRGADRLSDFVRDHRASGLSAGRRGLWGGPGPGDRLPDLPVTTDEGDRRLHDLLSYRQWTLLRIGADGGAAAGAVALRALTRRYALPVAHLTVRPAAEQRRALPDGTLLLVRPDGHIGLRTGVGDLKAVTAYLDRWSCPRDTSGKAT